MSMILIWFAALSFSCSKGDSAITPSPVPPPVIPVPTAPVQYGTPFANVPAPADAIIYQVNMRAFSNGGKLQGVTDRLDSIKALGVNVIYLMPVYPVGTTRAVNSPYCITDFGSVAPEFGSLTDLRNLVDAAHSKNMAVIMDWVANHTSWDHPWIAAHKNWYQQDGSGNIISPPGTGWNDVAALNYANADLRKAMIAAMKYWVYNANIDGYRCDAADFIPGDFWKQSIDSLRAINTHRLLMFAEGSRNDHFTAGFQLSYGFGFFYTLKNNVFGTGYTAKAIDSVNAAEYTHAGTESQVVHYTSNHDVNLTEGTPAELFGGSSGALCTFILATYLKGIPMIYNGQEIGYPVRLNYFNNSTPITWMANPVVTEAYKKILAFRKTSDAVRTGTVSAYSSNDVCVFVKTKGTEKVLVLVNLRNAAVNYTMPAVLANTSWTDAMLPTATVNTGTQLSLPAYGYYILKN